MRKREIRNTKLKSGCRDVKPFWSELGGSLRNAGRDHLTADHVMDEFISTSLPRASSSFGRSCVALSCCPLPVSNHVQCWRNIVDGRHGLPFSSPHSAARRVRPQDATAVEAEEPSTASVLPTEYYCSPTEAHRAQTKCLFLAAEP